MAISIDGISMNNLNNLISDSSLVKNNKADAFSDVLSAMMSSIDETNDLQNFAEQESIRFALGEAENSHDLAIAQSKALTAIQYTVAVRDKVIEAYKEIMQMQI